MTEEPSADLRPYLPHGARMGNYWLVGADNYPAEQAVADAAPSGGSS